MKREKKIMLYSAIFALLVAGILVAGAGASPEVWYDELVPHVLGFEIPTGQYCVTDYRDGEAFTTCYCPCETGKCEVDPVVPTDEPVDPTETPKPPDPTPEPTKKPKCNSGRGNGSEGDPDCDPGNSGGHNQGGD